MTFNFCRAPVLRNFSGSSPSFSNNSNHSNISDAEWITNVISLIIFIIAFIGNTAALIVMFGSRGPIRLTNNKYLANLACADLLRACFMPFTIVARMKRNFIFGRIICKVLPIVQGLSVAVDVFTLVCISIERYLAICHPLLILNLQSVRFSNLLNVLVLFSIWFLGLLTALPNLHMYRLCPLTKLRRFKCERVAAPGFDERIYMVALVAFYFVIPIVVMIVLYTLIIWKMYRNNTAMKMRSTRISNPCKPLSCSSTPTYNKCSQYQSAHKNIIDYKRKQSLNFEKFAHQSSHRSSSSKSRSGFSEEDQRQNPQFDMSIKKQEFNRTRSISHPISRPSLNDHHYRNSNNHIIRGFFQRMSSENGSRQSRRSSAQGVSRIDRHRRKALKLLITLIVEFFVCWTPLFSFHTIGTFDRNFYRSTANVYLDLILLFSFASASCNPLTYYFMSKRYRSVLYAYLPSCFTKKNKRMFNNQKNEQTHPLIKALRIAQQQNLVEKKPKERTIPTINGIREHSRLRSHTLY